MLSPLPLSFVTILETGSITGAADHLGLAKSAVSQNLKRLEGHLGVKLLVRSTRRMSVTPAGERYYRRCKEILALSRQAETEMEAFGAEPTGPITITAPHALIAPVIAPALASVTRRFGALEPVVVAEDKRLE
ncbi:MAG: LysR family transcriptional regulator, partial [Pseudomonadota bacterium]